MNKHLALSACAICALAALQPCAAQTYPTKPVRVIVPFPPGGGTDVFARVVAQKVGESLRQQFVVENRPGAQGNIGMAMGAKAPPDGYTLTVAFSGTMAINPVLYGDVGFDPLKDFSPISPGTSQPEVLVAHPAVPAKTVKELVALARREPGRITIGSSASTGQLVVELLKQLGKVNVAHAPYKGAAFAMTDLMSGYLDFAVMSIGAAVPHHRSGKAKALVSAGPARASVLPGVPSAPESGLPDLQVVGWYAVVGPAGLPKEIVSRLSAEINRALEAADVKERLHNVGLTPKGGTPDELGALIRSDVQRLGKVVRDSGMKPTS
jgi:tripartite-type tricarboxylate transporter receptor subunit TctC